MHGSGISAHSVATAGLLDPRSKAQHSWSNMALQWLHRVQRIVEGTKSLIIYLFLLNYLKKNDNRFEYHCAWVSCFLIQAGLALGDLQSVGDLYDFNSIATLFLIGLISVTPTLMSKSES